MLLLVRKHGDVALALHFAPTANNCSHADGPAFAFLEFVASVLVQLLLCKPQRLLVVQALTADALSADVRDRQDRCRHILVNTLLTLDHLKHSFGYVVATYVNPQLLQTYGDRLLRSLDQVRLVGVFAKRKGVSRDLAVVVGGLLECASVALLLGEAGLLIEDVLRDHVVDVHAQRVCEAPFAQVFAVPL